jgi:hypothetical protein
MVAFWVTFGVLAVIIALLEKKYGMLKDQSSASPQPFSWSRVQLTWWTLIILSSFIGIYFTRDYQLPQLLASTVILLGISGATTVVARTMDVSDINAGNARHQDQGSQNFFLDILSDSNGVSIHRFQTIVFNLVFGCWYVTTVLHNIDNAAVNINSIIPDISNNNLILLGISSATYAALKSSENTGNNVAASTSPATTITNPAPNAVTPVVTDTNTFTPPASNAS